MDGLSCHAEEFDSTAKENKKAERDSHFYKNIFNSVKRIHWKGYD